MSVISGEGNSISRLSQRSINQTNQTPRGIKSENNGVSMEFTPNLSNKNDTRTAISPPNFGQLGTMNSLQTTQSIPSLSFGSRSSLALDTNPRMPAHIMNNSNENNARFRDSVTDSALKRGAISSKDATRIKSMPPLGGALEIYNINGDIARGDRKPADPVIFEDNQALFNAALDGKIEWTDIGTLPNDLEPGEAAIKFAKDE